MRPKKDARALEIQLRELVRKVADTRWQRDGRYSPKDILSDIRSDEGTWRAMADLLVEKAATLFIRREMAAREPEIDPAQERFQFAKELPVPSITSKGTIVSTLRATAEEFTWHTRWYKLRLAGVVKRSKFDKETLAKLERFDRYCRDNPGMDVKAIVEARQKRLTELRKHREIRRRRNSKYRG